jgi:hypothetical protein
VAVDVTAWAGVSLPRLNAHPQCLATPSRSASEGVSGVYVSSREFFRFANVLCALVCTGIADTPAKRCVVLTDLVVAASIASSVPATEAPGTIDEGELRDILSAMKRAPGGVNMLWDILNANFGPPVAGHGLPGTNLLQKVRVVLEGAPTGHRPSLPFLAPDACPNRLPLLPRCFLALCCLGQMERHRIMAELMRVLETTYVSEDGGPVAPPPSNAAYVSGLFTVLKAANAVVVKPKAPPADGSATSTEDFGGGAGREMTGSEAPTLAGSGRAGAGSPVSGSGAGGSAGATAGGASSTRGRLQAAAKKAVALSRTLDGELGDSDAVKAVSARYMGSVVERTLRLLRALNTSGADAGAVLTNSSNVKALMELFESKDGGAAASSVRVRCVVEEGAVCCAAGGGGLKCAGFRVLVWGVAVC